MKLFTTITVSLLLGSLTLHAEPSVYSNTNGFSSPQKNIHLNSKVITELQYKIAQQKEQIEGLRSIVEGLSATVGELQQGVYKSTSSTNDSENISLNAMRIRIDKINQNYVTKEELKNVMGGQSIKKNVISTPSVSTDKSIADVYSEGVRLFVKKRFNEAKKRFIMTDTKGYKVAPSNYYLGEIAYYTKKYEDAIFYFKKSAGINDKASYIDTLLLHTAISLENRGERVQAKAFYENIVINYDGKKTASIAREKLKNL